MAEIHNNLNISGLTPAEQADKKKANAPEAGKSSFKEAFAKQIKETQEMQVFVNKNLTESESKSVNNTSDLVEVVKDAGKSLDDLSSLLKKGRAVFDSLLNKSKDS